MRKSEPFTVYVWLTMNGVKWHNELRWVHSIGILIVIIMLIMITAVRVLDVRVIASIAVASAVGCWCCQLYTTLQLQPLYAGSLFSANGSLAREITKCALKERERTRSRVMYIFLCSLPYTLSFSLNLSSFHLYSQWLSAWSTKCECVLNLCYTYDICIS